MQVNYGIDVFRTHTHTHTQTNKQNIVSLKSRMSTGTDSFYFTYEQRSSGKQAPGWFISVNR